MPILASCQCGKKVRVKDELAGKRVKCPGCARVIVVPAAEVPEVEMVAEEVPAQVLAEEAERRPGPSAGGADSPTPYWVRGDELLALTNDAVYLITLDEKKMPKARAALEAGEPADAVLEGAGTVIELGKITKVEGNLYHTFFEIKFKEPGASEESEKTIYCEDQASRDELVKALRQRLGPDWKRDVKKYTRLRASMEPLIVIGVFGFITYCFYMVGAHPESDRSGGTIRTNWIGAILIWVYNLLGPWGVVSLGGVIVALGIAWLVARLMKPPLMFTLAPREAPRRKGRK